MHRRPTVVAVAVLLTTAVAAPALAGVVAAQEGGQQIEECRTINESGTYELAGPIGANASANATNGTADTGTNETGGANGTDLPAETGDIANEGNVSACVAVEASDVTFEGNGYAIDGSDDGALNLSGADQADATNATADANASADANESLAAGVVVRPPTENGTVSNVTVANVTVRNWDVGVYVQDARNVTLRNVTFENNAVPGFRLDNATGLSIQNANQTGAQAD